MRSLSNEEIMSLVLRNRFDKTDRPKYAGYTLPPDDPGPLARIISEPSLRNRMERMNSLIQSPAQPAQNDELILARWAVVHRRFCSFGILETVHAFPQIRRVLRWFVVDYRSLCAIEFCQLLLKKGRGMID